MMTQKLLKSNVKYVKYTIYKTKTINHVLINTVNIGVTPTTGNSFGGRGELKLEETIIIVLETKEESSKNTIYYTKYQVITTKLSVEKKKWRH